MEKLEYLDSSIRCKSSSSISNFVTLLTGTSPIHHKIFNNYIFSQNGIKQKVFSTPGTFHERDNLLDLLLLKYPKASIITVSSSETFKKAASPLQHPLPDISLQTESIPIPSPFEKEDLTFLLENKQYPQILKREIKKNIHSLYPAFYTFVFSVSAIGQRYGLHSEQYNVLKIQETIQKMKNIFQKSILKHY